MSAVRYSGRVRLRITYQEPRQRDVYADGTLRHPNGSYRCVVSSPAGVGAIEVGAPEWLPGAVDSSEAFDGAAEAALAFAGEDVGEFAAFDDRGYVVTRQP